MRVVAGDSVLLIFDCVAYDVVLAMLGMTPDYPLRPVTMSGVEPLPGAIYHTKDKTVSLNRR